MVELAGRDQDEALGRILRAQPFMEVVDRNGADRLLGRGFTRFDMRDPTKLVARKGDTVVNHDVSEDSHAQPAVYDGGAGSRGQSAGGLEQG